MKSSCLSSTFLNFFLLFFITTHFLVYSQALVSATKFILPPHITSVNNYFSFFCFFFYFFVYHKILHLLFIISYKIKNVPSIFSGDILYIFVRMLIIFLYYRTFFYKYKKRICSELHNRFVLFLVILPKTILTPAYIVPKHVLVN